MVCLTNLRTRYPPMPPKLNRRRAEVVLSSIDAILAWEAQHENERDTRFVELGKCLCEVQGRTVLAAGESEIVRRVSGAAVSGIEAEGLLPDVDSRAPAAASEKRSEGGGLDQGGGIGEAGAQTGSALRKCNLDAQSPADAERGVQKGSGKGVDREGKRSPRS